ncbi:hypothetical protein TcasGA2_TC032518 [Tribolium castaneum]|uniref:Uncharacterized protein n=1 Tax=Tribolium castaneum TaxID=7070 RepID=A0A139WKG1_TRICA|nr:hypothetical protein TcasGA2_TC032518 [Tribolium castaneum]
MYVKPDPPAVTSAMVRKQSVPREVAQPLSRKFATTFSNFGHEMHLLIEKWESLG